MLSIRQRRPALPKWDLLIAVMADELEPFPRVLVMDEGLPVDQADQAERQDEHHDPEPDELEDAAVPDQDHTPIALERLPGKQRRKP